MSVQLAKRTLTSSFLPSDALLISEQAVTLLWKLVTTDAPTVVEYYLEFTDDPTGASPSWFREVDEQDTGDGVVTMAKVIRTFNENAVTTGLADGTHYLATPFSRKAQFVRVQMRVDDGAAEVTLTAPFGSTPQIP